MITDLSKVKEFYKVKLTKIKSSHKNVRTDEIVGFTYALPQEGEPFCLLSKGLSMGVRVIKTTPVKNLKEESFTTENSEYGFEVVEDKIDPSFVEEYLDNNFKNNIPSN
jgi:hypothetical protein